MAGEISHQAVIYRAVHRRIGETVSGLRSLDYGALEGEAIDALDQRAATVADLLSQIKGRYDAAARALDRFAGKLEELQGRNAALLAEALDLIDEQVAAAGTAADARDKKRRLTRNDADQVQIDRAQTEIDTATRRVDDLSKQIVAKRQAILDTAEEAGTAQAEAAAEIRAAMAADGLTMSGWEKFWGGVVDVARWISDNLSGLAILLSAAALLLGWGPFLGAALIIADLVVNALVMLSDIVLVIEKEKDWTVLLVDALGFVTFGAGRVAARGFEMAASAVRQSRALRGLMREAAAMSKLLGARTGRGFSQTAQKLQDLAQAARSAIGRTGLGDALRGMKGNWFTPGRTPFGLGAKVGHGASRDLTSNALNWLGTSIGIDAFGAGLLGYRYGEYMSEP
jgi:hypothetical protein